MKLQIIYFILQYLEFFHIFCDKHFEIKSLKNVVFIT